MKVRVFNISETARDWQGECSEVVVFCCIDGRHHFAIKGMMPFSTTHIGLEPVSKLRDGKIVGSGPCDGKCVRIEELPPDLSAEVEAQAAKLVGIRG